MRILLFLLGRTISLPSLPLYLGIYIMVGDLLLRNRCDRVLRRFAWKMRAHAVFPFGW